MAFQGGLVGIEICIASVMGSSKRNNNNKMHPPKTGLER